MTTPEYAPTTLSNIEQAIRAALPPMAPLTGNHRPFAQHFRKRHLAPRRPRATRPLILRVHCVGYHTLEEVRSEAEPPPPRPRATAWPTPPPGQPNPHRWRVVPARAPAVRATPEAAHLPTAHTDPKYRLRRQIC